jgi:hypothetical protein
MGTIISSLMVIALGAILRYAITATVGGVILPVVGMVLIVVGAVGLALGVYFRFREPSRGASTRWS